MIVHAKFPVWLSLRLDEHCKNAASLCFIMVVKHNLCRCAVPDYQETLMISPRRHYRTKFFMFDVCRIRDFWSQSKLVSAMDRLIRVSMKNAASCVIYYELQTLRVVKF